MSELSSQDQELLAGARAAFEPSAEAEDRVLAAVLAKVGPGAPPAPSDGCGPPAGAAPAAPTASGIAKAWLSAGLALGLAAAGGGYAALRGARPAPAIVASAAAPPAEPPAASAEPPAASAEVPSTYAAPPEVAAPPSAPAAAPRPRPRPTASAAPDADTLRREAARLREVQRALRDGDPDRALRSLESPGASPAGGVLGEERLAARVQALCLAGRTAEARAALAELRRLSLRSPQLARLSSSCAAR
jgi:hypothetical protein